MNSKTAKFLTRCANLRFREALAQAKKNRTEYDEEQQTRIQNHIQQELKSIWNRTPKSRRGVLRRQLEAEAADYPS